MPSSAVFRGSVVALVVATLVTIFLLVRPPESKSAQDTVRTLATPTPAFAATATATRPGTSQRTVTPTPAGSATAAGSPTAGATASAAASNTYTVRPGDTLSSIAVAHNTTVEAIRGAEPGAGCGEPRDRRSARHAGAAMNWDDDPEVQRALRERSARVSILRSAILWMPLFLVTFGALVYFFIDVVTGGEQGTVFLLVVLSVLSLLFGFQALQAVLDLAGAPHRETQLVTRRWSRNDSFVMRTHYIRLESGQILRGDKAMLNEIDAGHRVEVLYFRHSGVLIDVARLKEPKEQTPEAS